MAGRLVALTDAPSWPSTLGCEAWLSISIWMLVVSTGPAAKLMGSTRERWPPRTFTELDEKYVVSSEQLVSTSRSIAIGYIP